MLKFFYFTFQSTIFFMNLLIRLFIKFWQNSIEIFIISPRINQRTNIQMFIDQSGLSDNTIVSPAALFGQINSCSQSLGLMAFSQKKKFNSQKKNKTQQKVVQIPPTPDANGKKKKDAVGLKRLIRQQKIENIKRKFIAKLKLNNINSKPIQFQPYYQTQNDNFFDRTGVQIPDWLEKIISVLIVLTIFLCVFIDTTYIAFPKILQSNLIRAFQLFSLFVFIFELFSSMIFVKLVDGRKIQKIGQIFRNYFQNGFFIDLAYLIVLITDLSANSGVFRLIILLKLPECFERTQKIENSLINTFYKQQYWGLTKVFLLNFSLSHVLCILLILISNLDDQHSWLVKLGIQNAEWYEQYVWAYYWGTTIMLTVGFGDISPGNYKEAICIVLIQTFSCLALAYNINCVGNLISNIKSQDIQKNKNIKTFKILSNRNNLTQELEMKIHNYIQESTNIKKKFNFQEESNFISTLPRQLKADFLKQSNKKIFQNLIFFKNITQKTLLNFAQTIQMKICHPEQIIKKRGEIAGVMILKQGKLGLSTKLNGSDFNNTTIQTVSINERQDPFLLSLDFLSNDRSIYQIKSQQYSILYFLDRERTIQALKTGQLDYQHFCFLRDKSRNFQTDFEVFKCQQCQINHTKFQCPKLHYCPLKKHVIDKHLHDLKICKSQRKPFIRSKTIYNAFVQLQNNLKLFQIKEQTLNKYAGYKSGHKKGKKQQIILQAPKTLNWIRTQKNLGSNQMEQFNHQLSLIPTQKKIEYQFMAGRLKDQMQKILSNQHQVWLIETDQVKNFKFYFISYNARTLEYLNRKDHSKSVFM